MDFLQAWIAGGEAGKQQRTDRALRQNLQGALGGDQSAQAAVYQADPAMGMRVEEAARQRQQQGQQDAIGKLHNLASMYGAAPDKVKPMLYAQTRSLMEQAGLVPAGTMPADLTDPADQEGFGKLIATLTGSKQDQSHIISPGSAMVDASGRELYVRPFAPKTMEAQGGIYSVQGTSATPVTVGQSATGPTQADMESDIATANSMIASGIPEDKVDAWLASRGSRADSAPMGGGQQLKPAEKPMSEGERQRLAMEQERLRIEQAKFQASQEANAVNGKPPTEDERKAAGWFQQATYALKNMKDAIAADPSAALPGVIEQYVPGQEIKNRSMSPARQRYAQAAASFSEAALRAATGAGINEFEARQKITELTPQRGDSAEVIQQKLGALDMYVSSLQSRAGRALPQVQNKAQTTQSSPVRIQSAADYEALPSGTEFIAPDGSRRRKR